MKDCSGKLFCYSSNHNKNSKVGNRQSSPMVPLSQTQICILFFFYHIENRKTCLKITFNQQQPNVTRKCLQEQREAHLCTEQISAAADSIESPQASSKTWSNKVVSNLETERSRRPSSRTANTVSA